MDTILSDEYNENNNAKCIRTLKRYFIYDIYWVLYGLFSFIYLIDESFDEGMALLGNMICSLLIGIYILCDGSINCNKINCDECLGSLFHPRFVSASKIVSGFILVFMIIDFWIKYYNDIDITCYNTFYLISLILFISLHIRVIILSIIQYRKYLINRNITRIHRDNIEIDVDIRNNSTTNNPINVDVELND